MQNPTENLLWDRLPSPLWYGTPGGECIAVNEAFCKMAGLGRERLLAKGWMDLIPEGDRSGLLERLLRQPNRKQQFKGRVRLQTYGGTKSLRVSATVLRGEDEGATFVLVECSVTPKRASRDTLHSSLNGFENQTLRLCFEHAPVGIGFLDRDLHFLQSNLTIAKILTGSRGDLTGESLENVLEHKLPAISAAEIRRVCQETLTSGTPHTLHGWPLLKSNAADHQRVTDWEIRRIQTTEHSPVGLILTVSDATQQKMMQERLRLLASVLESTPDFVAVLSVEGNILYLNKSAREAAGLKSEASVHALHISDLQPQWATELLEREGFPQAIEDGAWEGETAFINVDGSHISVSQILCSHRNPDGDVEFLSTILRDVTEALDVRQQLAAARQSLEEKVAERSAELAEATALIRDQVRQQTEAANFAKNAFLSRMSHELRTPLNSILGFAQLLKLESPTPGQLESIGHIARAGEHLLSLINEVLDIAHIESGRLALTIESLELNGFLHNCVELMRPIASTCSIDLQLIAREKPFHVRGDRLRLKQVVLNFLSNAIKYNNEGGMVLVSLRLTRMGARFEVRDTGPGIPLEKRGRLFRPFERLGAEATEIEGTGIGLALCKGLMDAMGGSIGLENPDSGGCVFWAELPLADPAQEPQLQIKKLSGTLPHAPFPPLTLPLKVLAIESHDFDLQFLERLLQKKYPNCQLISAMQGDIGLELAREHRPDVLLLDLDLPDISPNEFLSRLQSMAPDLTPRIILLGSDSTSPEMRRLSSAFRAEILLKPYAPDELIERLRGALPENI